MHTVFTDKFNRFNYDNDVHNIVIIIIIAISYIALFRTEGPLKALYRYKY